MPNYVPGVGPIGGAKLMIIGEAPGKWEDEYRRPFVGPTGDLLDDLLKEAGIVRDECYVTNAVKYQPPNNDFKRLHEIGISIPEQYAKLQEEIRRVQPNCILALGDKALQATTGKSGIYNYRGSILSSRDGLPKVVSTLHPANLLYQRGRSKGKGVFKYAWKYVMIADLVRARDQSKFPEIRTPERVLKVCRDSLQLYRFLKQYEDKSIASIDIESINCVPVCVGIAFNKFEAISIPLYTKFNKIIISSTSIIDTAERWRLLAEFLLKIKIIGQNFKYDEEKLYRLGLRCGPLFADTLSLEHTLNPELPNKKLSTISSIRTEEPFYKDEGSEFNPSKDSIDQLLLYNGKDAAVTYEVWEDQDAELTEMQDLYSPNLRSFYYDYVVKLHKFYLALERTGQKIDTDVKANLNKKYTKWHNDIQKLLIEDCGHAVNVNSPKQVSRTIYDELHCPFRAGTGEDTLVQLITNALHDDKRKRVLSNIIDDRRVRKSKSTYINARPDYDGRMRTSYYITGTETGRSTTNKLKPPIRPESLGWSGHTITKHGDIGSDIRTMLVPDEGYVFLAVDKSQAEARVVAVLCEDWELLNAFGTVDIHRRTAGLVFGYVNSIELQERCSNPEVDELGKDSGERFIGKKTRHSGNYDIGDETFHRDATSEARKFGIRLDFSEYAAGKALNRFHAASPKIRGIFHRDVKKALDRTRTLVNPFGRVRRFLGRADDKLYREGYAQIPQSTVHDDITAGGIRIHDRLQGLRFVKEDHDSFTVLAPKNEVEQVARVMKEELTHPIDFMQCTIKRDIRLVIPVDFEIGENNYRDMVKLKI